MNPSSSPLAQRSITIAVILAALLPALIIACGGEEEAGTSGDEDNGTASDALQTVPVTASDFSFSPGTLSAQHGDPFELVLTNTGSAPHTFTIDELDVDAEVAAGEETTVSVTPSESGEFSFYCRFHRQQGMEGAITVSGAVSGDGGTTGAGPTVSPDDDNGYYDY